jgi:folate-binding protein YgfZ
MGWIDKCARGRLGFEGRDAASFLHALLTNDVGSLNAGQGVYALYLTPQGRVITDVRLHHRGGSLVADVPPGLAPRLAARFDQVIFSEDVRVSDISEELSELAAIGPHAAEALAARLGLDAARLTTLPMWSHVEIRDGFIARTDDTALPSFDVFAPPSRLAELGRSFTESGFVSMPAALLECFRIEAGHPAFGADGTEATSPLEAGLTDRAISLTKGCYVGQEVIVRVMHRGGGRVARLLVRLDFDDTVTDAPAAGTPLSVDGREAGRITSAAWSLGRHRAIALGYVRRELAEVGRRVEAGAAPATIVGLAG